MPTRKNCWKVAVHLHSQPFYLPFHFQPLHQPRPLSLPPLQYHVRQLSLHRNPLFHIFEHSSSPSPFPVTSFHTLHILRSFYPLYTEKDQTLTHYFVGFCLGVSWVFRHRAVIVFELCCSHIPFSISKTRSVLPSAVKCIYFPHPTAALVLPFHLAMGGSFLGFPPSGRVCLSGSASYMHHGAVIFKDLVDLGVAVLS